jgi:hypothetical protein
MELLLIYLWLKLDLVNGILGWSLMGLLLATAVTWFMYVDDCLDKSTFKKFAIWSSIVLATFVVIPSTKEMAILVVANYAIDGAKSPEGQKLWNLVRLKANVILDQEIKALQK